MTTAIDETGDIREVVIAGAGIAGLLLALALKKNLGVSPTVYEQATRFDDGVGGAMGMYPNGLRVVRDVSPRLLASVRAAGQPFVHRRWMRHDASEVAVALERCICDFASPEEEEELASLAIRRWRLQKALMDECIAEGIPVYFGRRTKGINGLDTRRPSLVFADGSSAEADLIFACDGVRSVIRNALFGPTDPAYTGVTCLMGTANIPRPQDGICFPSAATTRCHACYYPTGPTEQVFQLYFACPENPESWRGLSHEEGRSECSQLAQRLRADGWDEQFLAPLEAAVGVLRVGLRAREPIPRWQRGRVILLGDAAHPPVPYIGQGAMMAIEDVGVIVRLLQRLCRREIDTAAATTAASSDPAPTCRFVADGLAKVVELYQALRIPRTTKMLESSAALGAMQFSRATQPSDAERVQREQALANEVAAHGTLPIMWFGSKYRYLDDTDRALASDIPASTASVE